MIVLCGKTCSGKNFIRDLLVEKGIEPVITYTTRAMREGEIADRTYHFLTKEDFLQKEKEGFFVESTSYKISESDTRYYGSHFDKEDDNKVIILNPDGVDALINAKNLEVTPVVFYLDVPDNVLIQRSLKRGDKQEEVKKRLEIDTKDFQGIEKKVDMVLRNNGKTSGRELVNRILDFHKLVLENPLPWKPLEPTEMPKDKKKNIELDRTG